MHFMHFCRKPWELLGKEGAIDLHPTCTLLHPARYGPLGLTQLACLGAGGADENKQDARPDGVTTGQPGASC